MSEYMQSWDTFTPLIKVSLLVICSGTRRRGGVEKRKRGGVEKRGREGVEKKKRGGVEKRKRVGMEKMRRGSGCNDGKEEGYQKRCVDHAIRERVWEKMIRQSIA